MTLKTAEAVECRPAGWTGLRLSVDAQRHSVIPLGMQVYLGLRK